VANLEKKMYLIHCPTSGTVGTPRSQYHNHSTYSVPEQSGDDLPANHAQFLWACTFTQCFLVLEKLEATRQASVIKQLMTVQRRHVLCVENGRN
jgi:hypothetical protein